MYAGFSVLSMLFTIIHQNYCLIEGPHLLLLQPVNNDSKLAVQVSAELPQDSLPEDPPGF